MMINKSIIDKAFEMVDEHYGRPVQDDEITASKMFAEDNSVTMRTHLTRLKKMVEQGKMTSRVAKQGELAFRPVENDGTN